VPAVGGGHMFLHRCVPAVGGAAHVNRHPLVPMEDFDGTVGDPGPELLPDRGTAVNVWRSGSNDSSTRQMSSMC
jgi:hypothetical protein